MLRRSASSSCVPKAAKQLRRMNALVLGGE
jgi:hypothetical protein